MCIEQGSGHNKHKAHAFVVCRSLVVGWPRSAILYARGKNYNRGQCKNKIKIGLYVLLKIMECSNYNLIFLYTGNCLLDWKLKWNETKSSRVRQKFGRGTRTYNSVNHPCTVGCEVTATEYITKPMPNTQDSFTNKYTQILVRMHRKNCWPK